MSAPSEHGTQSNARGTVDDKTNAHSRLMTVEDVAQYLGVSERWVYEQVRSGALRALFIARSWRLRPEVVDTFAESFQWRPSDRRASSEATA